MADKEQFVKTKGLCFGCLCEGHRSKQCEQKLKCTKCDKLHPSSLHRADYERKVSYEDISKKDENDETKRELNMKTRDDGRIMCPAIPVTITNKTNGLKMHAYAALDNYSTSSYMNAELVKQLRLSNKKKSLNIQTIEGNSQNIDVMLIEDLEISNLNGSIKTQLTKVYAKNRWPFTADDSPTKEDLCDIELEKKVPFDIISGKIELLIGMDNPDILRPREIVKGKKKGPYASKHLLGWALNGPVKGSTSTMQCFRTAVSNKDDDLHTQLDKVFNKDFENTGEHSKYSIDETNWLTYVEENTNIIDGSFEVSLPFKDKCLLNGNNYMQVKSRFDNLWKKLKADDQLKDEYSEFMQMMIDNEFMEIVPDNKMLSDNGQQWYVAHHPVWHKQKNKIRVVFDCSLKYKGASINDALWKGPDLSNTLTGVLMRFRTENVAVAADISKMFYRVKLPNNDRNYFKFFWFDDNDIHKEPVVYRMTAHIFGATSSPAVANFALKKSVDDENSSELKCIVNNSFYVDDMLHSFKDEEHAINTLPKVEDALSKHGFDLTSYSSNSRNVLKEIPEKKLCGKIEEIDIDKGELPQERTLGIKWNINSDTIGYNINIPNCSSTKRGLLSTIHSIYDPLFVISPVIIPAKRLFQNCCNLKLNWDDSLPLELESKWLKWKAEIQFLNNFDIQRCYKNTCNTIKRSQLHIFCDGSEIAYGAVAFLRQVDSDNNVSSCIVMAKARLTPIARSALKTIPRIELNAAKLGVLLYEQVSEELKNVDLNEEAIFWTDSTAVLQYLRSETGRFHVFVANRVSYLRSLTNVNQWKKIPGKINPADLLSRGTTNVKDFNENKLWKHGPSFLLQTEEHWPLQCGEINLPNDDPELKKQTVFSFQISKQFCRCHE